MIERFASWLDARLGTAHFVTKAMRKAFPDHWTFMLGEINAYAFAVLVATGIFLALFFKPSEAPVVYHGPETLYDGIHVSQAYASTLALSFEVDGGLLVRQIHHWTALIFLAGIVVHMCRIFFTGAFRKPRELNWLIGIGLFALAMGEGFTGYSMPDDLLSGTGLRIFDSVLLSIPLVGTWLSFLLFGGTFPSDALPPRLFVAHVFLLPIAIAGLILLHLVIVWRQKHTDYPGPGKREEAVSGSPMVPRYAAKSLALFAAVVAVCCALGAFVQINPIWIWGPYRPWDASSPAQPDWYIFWLEGALRLGPPLALHVFGHTIPSPFWASVALPLILFVLVLVVPWADALLRGDRTAHNILDLPRDVPLRTAAGVAFLAFTGALTGAASTDVQARYWHVSVVTITHAYQLFCIFGTIGAFIVAYFVAKELRRLHGMPHAERKLLRRNGAGGFDEETIT